MGKGSAGSGALTYEMLAEAAQRMMERGARRPVEYVHPARLEDERRFCERLARGERIPLDELEDRLRAEGWDVDALNGMLFGDDAIPGTIPGTDVDGADS